MSSDGSNQQQLSFGTLDEAATYSPDGSSIVFDRWPSERGDYTEVMVMAKDGSGVAQLTSGGDLTYGFPRWSHSGSWLVGHALEGTTGTLPPHLGLHRLWTMNSDGTSFRVILDRGYWPVFLPDDDEIVFTDHNYEETNFFISALSLSDGTVTALTPGPADIQPDISPDGSTIAFSRCGAWPPTLTTPCDLYQMNRDATGLTRLTSDGMYNTEPRYSPSGREIAYVSSRSGNRDVWKMTAPVVRFRVPEIRMVFSVGERYYPVDGLFFDGDEDISNNAASYRNRCSPQGGIPEACKPTEIFVYSYQTIDSEDEGFDVLEYWVYYPYIDYNPLIVIGERHEHSFSSIFLWINRSSGNTERVALTQNWWSNHYLLSGQSEVLYVAVEKGGHGLALLQSDANGPLDLDGDGRYDFAKPYDADLRWPGHPAGFEGDFNVFSHVGRLSRIVSYGGIPVEGFGSAGIRDGPNIRVLKPLVGLISGDVVGLFTEDYWRADRVVLLQSSEPLQILFYKFYVEAPWLSKEFSQPHVEWSKLSLEDSLAKDMLEFVASLIEGGLKALARLELIPNAVMNLVWLVVDPIGVNITDEFGGHMTIIGGSVEGDVAGAVRISVVPEVAIYMFVNLSSSLQISVFGNGSYVLEFTTTNLTYTHSQLFAGNVSEGIVNAFQILIGPGYLPVLVRDSLREASRLGELIVGLPLDVFDSKFGSPERLRDALINKVAEVILKIAGGELDEATAKLLHDLIPKYDGEPRPSDWVMIPSYRGTLLLMTLRIVESLESLNA